MFDLTTKISFFNPQAKGVRCVDQPTKNYLMSQTIAYKLEDGK